MLVQSGYAALRSHNVVGDVTNEISVVGYTAGGVAIGTPRTITEDDANNRVVYDAPDTVFASLAVGQTVDGAVIYQDTGAGASNPLLAFIDLAPQATPGGSFTIVWDATGCFYLTTV